MAANIKPENYALWHGSSMMSSVIKDADAAKWIVEGKGVRVRDASGHWFLDARSSLWNVTLGYDNQEIIRAIKNQLDTLPFTQIIRYERPHELAVRFANNLQRALEQLGKYYVRFGNTGSQMTESAFMLSRYIRLAAEQNAKKTIILSLWDGYHGTGGGATALTGERILHDLFQPLMPDMDHVEAPYCYRCSWQKTFPSCQLACLNAIEDKILAIGSERISAIFVEPILGTGGIVPPHGYLKGIEQLCRKYDLHFIVDEVTTGFGRVGHLTRSEQIDVRPDMIVLGKGITSGYVPAAALAVSDRLYDQVFDLPSQWFFAQGSTTDGHPLAMAAGQAVLDILQGDGFFDSIQTTGHYLGNLLTTLKKQHSIIGDVRGVGMMWAIELVDHFGQPWSKMHSIRLACENRGVLINTTLNCIMILPPITLTKADCDELVSAIDQALDEE